MFHTAAKPAEVETGAADPCSVRRAVVVGYAEQEVPAAARGALVGCALEHFAADGVLQQLEPLGVVGVEAHEAIAHRLRKAGVLGLLRKAALLGAFFLGQMPTLLSSHSHSGFLRS